MDRLPVPFSAELVDSLQIPIEVDHFLLFQNFQVVPYPLTSEETLIFGVFIFLASITVLASLSQFRKIPFLIAGIGWIAVLTLANVNGLNIGGLNANLPLLLLILATLFPSIYFHIWGIHVGYWVRWILLAFSTGTALLLLCYLSPILQPVHYLAEQSLVIGLGLSITWIVWQGHAVLSGVVVLISKVNAGIRNKTSKQFLSISIIYCTFLFLFLLDFKGEFGNLMGNFSILYLLLPIGGLGWFSIQEKINQSRNLAGPTKILQLLYLVGFSSSLWTIWKLSFSHNQAGEELLKHVTLYSQLGFSLFFLIYVVANFFPLMNQGKPVHSILYRPHQLPYYHLRIGGTIAFLVITTYLEAVIAFQASSLTNSIVGDYYYQTNQKLEASILYESSWDRYRYNPKAKNLVAQLLIELNQPSLAKEHLEESFDLAPQVDNILLLAEQLKRENKPLEAIFYLENGLKFFPENLYLTQNLALLYTFLKMENEAKTLLAKVKNNHPVAVSNGLAIAVKLGEKVDSIPDPNELILSINWLAAAKKNGLKVSQATTEALKKMLEREKSPLLIQAGYRNLIATPNLNDPNSELALLDSLGNSEGFLDYSMQVQETAILRSMGAGRVNEAVKNLTGIAYRNPGDAAYYLNLSGLILAQQLDFEKASKDFASSAAKGFKAQLPIHAAVLSWANGNLKNPIKNATATAELDLLGSFTSSHPQKLFTKWKTLPPTDFKVAVALRLFKHKAHGLNPAQLQDLGEFLSGKIEREEDLRTFLAQPDWTNTTSLKAFIRFIGASEELTANPYLGPLIWSASLLTTDKLKIYEILQSASEFSKDPLIWAKKVRIAEELGLKSYRTEALEEMRTWMKEEEIEAVLAEI